MLPSDMNLKIRSGTVGYNNKIFISNGTFSLGRNEKVDACSANTPAMKSHTQMTTPLRDSNDVLTQKPLLIKTRNPLTTRKKLLWYSFWQVVLQYGICFSKIQ